MDLSRVKERETIRPRREPYWHRLRQGCFLGYRPAVAGKTGRWIARAYEEEGRAYKCKALGDFGRLQPSERFAAAKRAAEEFAELIESGGYRQNDIETVADACRAYALSRPEAESRFKRLVYEDPIAAIELEKLRRHQVFSWRERVETRPALVSRSKTGPCKTRARAPASINRDMVPFRAALNRVLAPGRPNSEAAWQEALRPIKNASGRRTIYLDREQRRALLSSVGKEAEPFLRILCLLPLRPGAAALLNAANFDARTSELSIGRDKSGRPRRILLPKDAASVLAKECAGKQPDDPVFARSSGRRWDRHTWNDPIAKAVAEVDLPAGTTAYALRHSTITDLVVAGTPLLTVAQISDTSVEMIERHYGHLIQERALSALSELAL